MNRSEFEAKLNKTYNGEIKPVTAYLNKRAVLVFKCGSCGLSFFGRPAFIVGLPHQFHVCNKPYGDQYGERLNVVSGKRGSHKKKKQSKRSGELFYKMVIDDHSPEEIAKELDMSLSLVMDYFKTEGLI